MKHLYLDAITEAVWLCEGLTGCKACCWMWPELQCHLQCPSPSGLRRSPLLCKFPPCQRKLPRQGGPMLQGGAGGQEGAISPLQGAFKLCEENDVWDSVSFRSRGEHDREGRCERKHCPRNGDWWPCPVSRLLSGIKMEMGPSYEGPHPAGGCRLLGTLPWPVAFPP